MSEGRASAGGDGVGTPDPRRDTQQERGLTCVSVYERTVRASTERVWENVHDWEHLPWLHGESFSSIDCVDSGRWGWRARIGLQPSDASRAILLELVVEPDEPRYVSRTLEGNGAGTEIWTHVDARSSDETRITVEFWLKDVAEGDVAGLGAMFTKLYTQLWDEDEEMMQGRERELCARGATNEVAPSRLHLGPADELTLPVLVDYAGRRFRVVRHAGGLVAHAVVCPHLLGPLGDAPVMDGRVVCPWHGYAFDVATGRECSGRRLRLAPAPSVRVDATGVWLEPALDSNDVPSS